MQVALIRLRAITARQGDYRYRLKSGAYFAVGCLRTRRRNRFSRTAQAVEVKFNGVVHFAFDAVSRLARFIVNANHCLIFDNKFFRLRVAVG